MPTVSVDGLNFNFPDDWNTSKYDEWTYYRAQFSRMGSGIKALDVLAIDPAKTGWLIEVKDYRIHPRTKPSDLAEEISQKIFDTLAALIPASINATELSEKNLAKSISRAKKLRVVLHLEQPPAHSRLRPNGGINPADVQQKLRQRLKPIDAHPLVSSIGNINPPVAWTVTGHV